MFKLHQIQDISVIDADGELSRRNMHHLEDLLGHLSRHQQLNIVLNMGELKHLDYRLVRRIAERIIAFQCDGGDLKMANASEYIRQILCAMGLEEELYPSVEEALLAFLAEEPSGALQ